LYYKPHYKKDMSSKETNRDWIDPEAAEWYFSSSSQCYMDKKALQVMNEKGKRKYEEVLALVRDKKFKNEFVTYRIDHERSGSWYANPMSKFFNMDHPMAEKGTLGMMNTWNNIVIAGTLLNGEKVVSSPCVFMSDDTTDNDNAVKWCYTSSGSLYKLGTKI
jgi:hypothetical protein